MVYVSAQPQPVDKAALLAGFGQRASGWCRTTRPTRCSPEALAAAIEADLAAGRWGSKGGGGHRRTTATTAVDPIEAIGSADAAARLWLHVDSGDGWLGHDPARVPLMWRGIEQADRSRSTRTSGWAWPSIA